MPRGVPALADVKSDVILAHILDPDKNPLPDKMEDEFKRVVSAARMLDDYPNERHVITLLQTAHNISKTQARTDIAHAKELFKTHHTFDYDFTFAWMIKDQLELIRACKLAGDFKNWNAAKKVLREMIGERPTMNEDPRRMEKNVFYIQVNNGTGNPVNVPLDVLRGMTQSQKQELLSTLSTPIVDDAQAEQIYNT